MDYSGTVFVQQKLGLHFTFTAIFIKHCHPSDLESHMILLSESEMVTVPILHKRILAIREAKEFVLWLLGT